MRTRIHVGLPVSNLEASIAFYQALFGAPPTRRLPDYANWRLDTPALHLALVASPQAQAQSTTRHYGVELFDRGELERWRARAVAAGLVPRDEDDVVCCHARADKAWMRDPDGNEWELWVRAADVDTDRDIGASAAPKPAPPKEPAKGSCCAPACCG